MIYANSNQSDAKKWKGKNLTALLPLGATEVHGDHLPLGTDTFLAEKLALKVEKELGEENCLILPGLPYGQVWSLRDCPGSIHIPDRILSSLLVEIGYSLERAGIYRLAVVNAHVGNQTAMKEAARKLMETSQVKMFTFTYPGADEIIKKVCESPLPHKGYFHACEIETSYMLYLCPEMADMEKAVCQYPEFPEEFDYTQIRWTEVMDAAVLGDAKAATAEKGKQILDAVVHNICRILRKDG